MKRRKQFKKITALLVSIGIIFSPANINVFAEDNSELGVYDGDNFQVSYSIKDNWESNYIVDVSVKNTTDTTIEDWCLIYLSTDKITDIWNAAVEQNNNITVISNSVYNQDIAPGEIVSYSFCVDTEELYFPDKFELVSEPSVLNDSAYSISFDVINDWGEGYNAGLTITNTSDTIIEDWYLNFDWNEDIDYLWNAKYTDFSENHKRFNNSEYNQNIAPGDSVTIGIQNWSHGNPDMDFANFQLYEYGNTRRSVIEELTAAPNVSINTNSFKYNEDENYYNIYNKCNSLNGTLKPGLLAENASYKVENMWGKVLFEGDFTPKRRWEINNLGFVLGLNKVTLNVNYSDGSTSQTSEWFMNYCEENMTNVEIDQNDPDNDGLINYLEEIYGTDPNLFDTDGDGLSDYQELVDTGTNPLQVDSDNDGILDGNIDYDNDDISTSEEFSIGTSPFCIDTDGDLLSDNDEYYIYNTNPCNSDTDGDGALDKWEIDNGYNPLVYNEEIVSEASANAFGVSATVKIVTENRNSSTLNIHSIEENTLINSSIPGYIGNAFDITLDGNFNSAELEFDFDDTLIEDELFEPTIYYFNEETLEFEEIETSWDRKSSHVSAKLEHFSTYILLNKIRFEKALNQIFSTDIQALADKDIVFLLDASGSMSSSDSQQLREDAAGKIVDNMRENDRAQVLAFDDNIYKYTSLFINDSTQLKSAIEEATFASGGTRIGYAMSEALSLFSDIPNERERYIILFTDGQSADKLPDEYDQICDSKKINVITIGLGQNVDEDFLKSMTKNYRKNNSSSNENESVSYFHASTADEIDETYNKAKDFIYDDDDLNGDKIPDSVAEALVYGKLTTTHGNPFYGYTYEDIKNSKDLDGDGLLNGQELLVTISKDGNVGFVFKSDPTKYDTDNDGYNDLVEKNNNTDPMFFDISLYDFNQLTDSNIYMSSSMSEGYKESERLKIKLFIGNMLFNCKLGNYNIYKEALIQFLTDTQEESLNNISRDIQENSLYKTVCEIKESINKCCEYYNKINNPAYLGTPVAQVELYEQLTNSLIESANRADNLYKKLLKSTDVVERDKLAKSIINETNNCYDFIEKIEKNYYVRVNNNGRNIKFPIKVSSKIGSKVANGLNKTLSYMGWVAVGLNSANDFMDDYYSLTTLLAAGYNYEIYDDILERISHYSDNDSMVNVARDLRWQIIDNETSFLNKNSTYISDILTNSAKGVKTFAAGANSVVLVADLGLDLGEILWNVSSVDLGETQTIALGEASSSLSKSMIYSITYEWSPDCLYKDTENFYLVNNIYMYDLYYLSKLRIYSEKTFTATFSKFSKPYVFLYNLTHKKDDELDLNTVENFCNDTTECLNDLLIKYHYFSSYTD